MDFSEVVRRRRMIRTYADRPVDPAMVDQALRNATHAPSAGFSQGWGFLRLDTPEDTRRFWVANGADLHAPSRWLAGLATAPVIIVPCSSKATYLDRYAEADKGWTDRDEDRWTMPYWHMDTAMASLLILQTATDLGLGACFFGLVKGREGAVCEEFGIPDRFDPIGAITIGHRLIDVGSTGSAGRRERTDWTEVVHHGNWSV